MGDSNLTWLNLEQLAHNVASWSETGASPSELLRMFSQSSSRFSTFAILSILSRSIPVSTDFASLVCPLGITPLPDALAALW